MEQARKQLAATYRDAKAGRITPSEANARTNILRTFIEAELAVKAERELTEVRAALAKAQGAQK